MTLLYCQKTDWAYLGSSVKLTFGFVVNAKHCWNAHHVTVKHIFNCTVFGFLCNIILYTCMLWTMQLCSNSLACLHLAMLKCSGYVPSWKRKFASENIFINWPILKCFLRPWASTMLTLYWIPRKRTEPRRFFLAAIEKQLPVGVQNVRAKNFPVNIDVDLYTLRLLILPKLAPK